MLKKIIILVFVTCFACFNTVFAAESGGMPQLNPEFWISQIFWLIITFGVLFIVLTKVILPKISDNLETRKSQILENIETADKQKVESQKKIDEYEKIILDSKIKAKNYFNEAREKILEDINKKRNALEKDLDEEISSVENELSKFRNKSGEKINKIAAETSAEIIKELDPKEKQVSRAEMFSSPKSLDELYLEIDRISLKKNTFYRWIKSKFFPERDQ